MLSDSTLGFLIRQQCRVADRFAVLNEGERHEVESTIRATLASTLLSLEAGNPHEALDDVLIAASMIGQLCGNPIKIERT